MKRLILIFLALYLVLSSVAFAQVGSSNPTGTMDYQLPYPGILPDNPLYNLKTFRDRLISFFISDPIKKAEFNLLQADKRLSVAVALSQKGENTLAETTVSKGENYFDEAIKSIKSAKLQGRVVDSSLLTNMELSAKKHKQVLGELSAKSKIFESDFKRTDTLIKQVEELKPQ